jgi:ATP-dependent exoDNAse (exonuclease V) beta subunit
LHQDLRSAGATVLTVPESKGLEMNDVLLYNFWSDSLAKDEWRWLLNYLDDMDPSNTSGVVVGQQGRRFALDFPFDADKFKLLETELKQLYVAITRPRARLWIFDQGRDGQKDAERDTSAANTWCRTPVFEFLQRTGLVEVMFENTDEIEPFARASESTAEIEAVARQLYERGCRDSNVDMLLTAADRYEEAGKHTQAEVCRARYLVS